MRAIDKKVNTMVAERAQYAANEKTHANRKNICKLREKHLFDNTCAANTHNAIKYRNSLQILAT